MCTRDKRVQKKDYEPAARIKSSSTDYIKIRIETDKMNTLLESARQIGQLWQLAIPALVILIVIPSYLFLKKQKAERPDEPEEEEFTG